MAYGGIAVHKKHSPMCPFAAACAILQQRIETQRERFAAVFGPRPPVRILIAASIESALCQKLRILAQLHALIKTRGCKYHK